MPRAERVLVSAPACSQLPEEVRAASIRTREEPSWTPHPITKQTRSFSLGGNLNVALAVQRYSCSDLCSTLSNGFCEGREARTHLAPNIEDKSFIKQNSHGTPPRKPDGVKSPGFGSL